MTPRDWLAFFATYPAQVGACLAALPLLALLLGWSHPRGHGNDAPWKYFYSLIVYAVCIPGMFAATITLYLILFVGANLLDVNALVTVAPLVSMAVTLAVAGRNVDFGPLPGFSRLSGLMVTLGLTFAVVFALSRTRLWIVFGGSIFFLVAAGAFVFALIKWGGYLAFRRRDEPRVAPPRFGE